MTTSSKALSAALAIGLLAFSASAALAAPKSSSTAINETVNQWNVYNLAVAAGKNTATIKDNAFAHATGNVGLNVAAGDLNQQANVAYVDASAGAPTFAFTGTFNQYTANEDAGAVFGGSNKATVKNSAFTGATGNVGLNVASGAQNSQLNGLMVAENDTGSNFAISQALIDTNASLDGGNTARIRDYAFDSVIGNVGLNVAAGNLNQQANVASIVTTGATDADLLGSTFSISQGTLANTVLNCLSGSEKAVVQNDAFGNAEGNIGANLAAGNGNQQANALVVDP